MPRYFVQLAYNGTSYHGWQIQPNANSVQEDLNKVFTTLLREEINLVGAGRTDTGVHASFFVAHFDCEKPIGNIEQLLYKMKSMLDKGIYVQNIFEVGAEDHARFGALSRTYHYFFSQTKQPFLNEFCDHFPFDLDIPLMNNAAKKLFNYTDFTSFSKLHTDVKTNNCKIMKARWFEKGDLLVLEIKADRFLRNMVRAITGTILDVGRGKISLDEFKQIIEAKDRGKAGTSVKAQGLFLTDIEYPEHIERQLKRESHFML